MLTVVSVVGRVILLPHRNGGITHVRNTGIFPIRRLNGHIVFTFSHKYCTTSNTIWHSFNYQTYHLEGERKSRNVLPTCAYASYTKIHLGIQICGCAEPSRIHIVRDVFQSVSLRTTKRLAIRYIL